MNAREPVILYVAALATAGAAISLAIKGSIPQALILAAGAAFLIYWGRRTDERRGER
ncbi:MAG: hypothetical protein QOG63_3105 [Thermoleophilaceae bacterium]|nr:hypothetical protein [Thermoleophilaceae bacterium]